MSLIKAALIVRDVNSGGEGNLFISKLQLRLVISFSSQKDRLSKCQRQDCSRERCSKVVTTCCFCFLSSFFAGKGIQWVLRTLFFNTTTAPAQLF
jgi:hypothetical protein